MTSGQSRDHARIKISDRRSTASDSSSPPAQWRCRRPPPHCYIHRTLISNTHSTCLIIEHLTAAQNPCLRGQSGFYNPGCVILQARLCTPPAPCQWGTLIRATPRPVRRSLPVSPSNLKVMNFRQTTTLQESFRGILVIRLSIKLIRIAITAYEKVRATVQ